MNPSCFPDHLNVWAKSALDGEDRGESLAEHTWNVLARLSDLVHVRHQLTDYLNIPNLWHCLYWACFLHDLGKSARGFQDMVRKGIRWGQRHEVLSLAFLDWIAPALSETECSWILAAIVSHHRDAKYIAEKYDEDMDPDPVAGMLAELDETTVRGLWQWLFTCGAAWIEDLDLQSFGVHMLPLVPQEQALRLTCVEGRQRIHTWLEHYRMFVRKLSSERDLRIVSTLISLRGMTTTADHMASAHLKEVPRGVQCSWKSLAQECIGSVEGTHIHQRSSAAQHDTSAMLVAPTGSGKTEASLFWAVGNGLQAVPRIFYTLPYQASMNAMYDRLRLPQYFGEDSVGLQHGRALHALYQRMIDGEQGPKTVAQEAAWRQNLTTLHAYPVKVFSPYQMLKTVYQIKGFEGMLTDYAQAAFIFDEIHAYDPARLAIILCLVKYLREHFGARFFIMSATFPCVLQTILTDILKVNEPIVAEKNLFEQFQRHYLRLLDGELVKEGIESILADVRQ
jgi:CRISPR-associated endonuclease/helicase Cas3